MWNGTFNLNELRMFLFYLTVNYQSFVFRAGIIITVLVFKHQSLSELFLE